MKKNIVCHFCACANFGSCPKNCTNDTWVRSKRFSVFCNQPKLIQKSSFSNMLPVMINWYSSTIEIITKNQVLPNLGLLSFIVLISKYLGRFSNHQNFDINHFQRAKTGSDIPFVVCPLSDRNRAFSCEFLLNCIVHYFLAVINTRVVHLF